MRIYEPVKFVKISLDWEDKVGMNGKGFSTVQELAEFLKEHPQLAEKVGYVPKKK